MALTLCLAFCIFSVQIGHCAVRNGVKANGPTVPPSFKRMRGKLATSCPISHPFPFGNFTQCCSNKKRDLGSTCPTDGGDDLLLGSDPAACCPQDEPVSCAEIPCKMHKKGYERNGTQALLLGRHGTYIWKFNPKDTTYRNPNKRWAMQVQDPRYFYPGGATEYPRGSGKVVVCGGTLRDDGAYPRNRNCTEYDFTGDSWSSFPELVFIRGEAYMFTTDDGTLHILGGYSHDDTVQHWGNYDTTEYFDDSSRSWKKGHDLPDNMIAFGATHLSGSEVFLAGGWPVNTWTKAVYIFDINTGHSRRMADLPMGMARFALGKMTLDGDLALVATAHFHEDWTMANSQNVRIYTMGNDTWNENAAWDFPGEKRYIDMQRMVNVDNKLYLFSGTNGIDGTGRPYHRDVWRFNGPDATPVWTRVGYLPQNDHIDAAVLVTVLEPY